MSQVKGNREYFVDLIQRLDPELHTPITEYTGFRDVVLNGIICGDEELVFIRGENNFKDLSEMLIQRQDLSSIYRFGYEISADKNMPSKEMKYFIEDRVKAVKKLIYYTFDKFIYGHRDCENDGLNFGNIHKIADDIALEKCDAFSRIMMIREDTYPEKFMPDTIICGENAFKFLEDKLKDYIHIYSAPIPANRCCLYNRQKSLELKIMPPTFGRPFLRGDKLTVPVVAAIDKGVLSIKNLESITCIEILLQEDKK